MADYDEEQGQEEQESEEESPFEGEEDALSENLDDEDDGSGSLRA